MDPDKILEAYVGPRPNSNLILLKFWRPGPKGSKMAAKKWVFL